MRKWSVALVLAASVSLAACVQTKQYADLQFTPPQGDYKLLVLRPDVTVGSLTTGGMVEPRADWTDQARASIVAALRAQQAARGGKVTIIEHRNELPGVDPQELADVERLNAAVDEFDRAAQISRRLSADQARQQARLDARRRRRPPRPEDRLRLCLVPPRRGPGRVGRADRARRARPRRLHRRLLRAERRRPAAARLCLAGRSQDRRRRVVQRRPRRQARCRGSSSATSGLRKAPQQMVERLLGRMKPGQAVRRAQEVR